MPNGSLGPDAHQTVHVGRRLRAHRDRAGLNQSTAASRAGISRNTLVGLEGTRFPNPNLETLIGLMRAYGLRSLEELLGEMPSERLEEAWNRPPRANAPDGRST